MYQTVKGHTVAFVLPVLPAPVTPAKSQLVSFVCTNTEEREIVAPFCHLCANTGIRMVSTRGVDRMVTCDHQAGQYPGTQCPGMGE